MLLAASGRCSGRSSSRAPTPPSRVQHPRRAQQHPQRPPRGCGSSRCPTAGAATPAATARPSPRAESCGASPGARHRGRARGRLPHPQRQAAAGEDLRQVASGALDAQREFVHSPAITTRLDLRSSTAQITEAWRAVVPRQRGSRRRNSAISRRQKPEGQSCRTTVAAASPRPSRPGIKASDSCAGWSALAGPLALTSTSSTSPMVRSRATESCNGRCPWMR